MDEPTATEASSGAGVIEGIFIAVALALLDFIRRAWRPYDAVLGRVDPGLR